MQRLIILALAVMLGALPARANEASLDGNRNPFQLKTILMPDGSQAPGHVIMDPSTGAPYSPTDAPPLPNGAAQDGTDISGFVYRAGGAGIRGLLSMMESYLTAPDIRPASCTLTVADGASSTASGQNGATLVTGAPTTGSICQQAINGDATARITLAGSFSGQAQFEASFDGGVTFVPTGAKISSTRYVAALVSGPGIYLADVGGATHFRVRILSLASGSVGVTLAFSPVAAAVNVLNSLRLVDNTSGAEVSIKPPGVYAGAVDSPIVTTLAPTTGEVGTPGLGIAQPSGGIGVSGWLSGIYYALTHLSVGIANNSAYSAVWSALSQGGLPIAPGNPLFAALSQSGQPVSTINPLPTAAAPLTSTNCGGSIATGGTSQQVAAASTTRKRYRIQNPVSTTTQGIGTTEDLFVMIGAGASTSSGQSIELLPGGSIEDSDNGTINVVAATTGHQFACTTMQ
jgi:hypothetical protein